MKLLLIHMLKPILEIKRSTGNKTTCRDTHRANQENKNGAAVITKQIANQKQTIGRMVNSLKLSPGELQDVSPELQAESMISSQSPTSIQNRPLNYLFKLLQYSFRHILLLLKEIVQIHSWHYGSNNFFS